MTAARKTLLAILRIALCVVLCLAAFDMALRTAVSDAPMLQKPVDIQSAEMLSVKLDALRKFDGIKIVVFGDSLAFGRSMRDHGDKNWVANSLPSKLHAALAKKYEGHNIMVANLGMNGILPADMDQLVRILDGVAPDLLVFDLTLRSFSREFAKDDVRMSRPWLADIGQGRKTLADVWYLYRLRDTLQALAFDGPPSAWAAKMRDALDAWFKGTQAQSAADPLLLLMRARGRYDQIDVAADNPQVQALESLLARTAVSNRKVIAFYGTENAEMLPDLMDKRTYAKLQKQLKSVMAKGGKNVEWLGPLAVYKPEDYLDHVHLNAQGYDKLVARLMPLVETALK